MDHWSYSWADINYTWNRGTGWLCLSAHYILRWCDRIARVSFLCIQKINMNDLLVYESCRRLTQTVWLNWKDLSTKQCAIHKANCVWHSVVLYRYIENIEISIRYRCIVSYRRQKYRNFRYIAISNFDISFYWIFIHLFILASIWLELEIFLAAPNIPIYQSLDDDASTSHHDAAQPILTPL